VRPLRPLAELPEALVGGLQRDVRRCYAEERGLAVLIDAGARPAP
jgi:hypothetical protein